MRIGLTGGIGSGKSEVAKIFEGLGAFVIDTDALARDVVGPTSDALMEIAREWPAVVRDGLLDRAQLGAIVFADAGARAKLNAILHPHIRRAAMQREMSARPHQPIVHVVPLLFETDYARLVDRTVLVVAPDAERVARVRARDGSSEAEVRARMAAQIAPARARLLADATIENDADLETLRARARAVYRELVGAG